MLGNLKSKKFMITTNFCFELGHEFELENDYIEWMLKVGTTVGKSL